VVVEDLHWAEPPLLEMIERILARSSGRLFVVATARPEFAEMRPGWGSWPGISQIALEPLTAEQSRELLSELLPDARPEIHETVIAAAEGNPFFTEEIVRHLGDSENAAALPIPSTVWALLAARIDALPDAEKAVLQDAAVVGRAFWPPALEAMRPGRTVDDSLRALEDKGLIVTRPTSSLPGQTELWFRQFTDPGRRLWLYSQAQANRRSRGSRRLDRPARGRPSRRVHRAAGAPLRGGGHRGRRGSS
jgi:predicted ATPase